MKKIAGKCSKNFRFNSFDSDGADLLVVLSIFTRSTVPLYTLKLSTVNV